MTEDFSGQYPYGLSDLPDEPLGTDALSYPAGQLSAWQIRRTARGKDVMDRVGEPSQHVPWSSVAPLALSLLPFSGTVDAGGAFPDFNGGYDPSAVANLKNGNIGALGWQGLGLLGDYLYLNPYTAAAAPIVKLPGALRRAARTDLTYLTTPVHRSDAVQAELRRHQPPKGVPARTLNMIDNPEVAAEMKRLIKEGLESGAEWYNTEALRQAFMKELGAVDGDTAYNRFLSHVAAASPLSSVGESIRNASYYYGRLMRGEGLPRIGDPNPEGYGHAASKLHQRLLHEVEGKGFDPVRHAKILSFIENLRGNHMPVTVDMHAFRLPAMLSKDPQFLKPEFRNAVIAGELSMEKALKSPKMWQGVRRSEYAAVEQFYRRIADELGITPAQAQAAAWIAGGAETGLKSTNRKSFMDFFDNRLAITAKERGLTYEEALREFIRGRVNLSFVDEPGNSFA